MSIKTNIFVILQPNNGMKENFYMKLSDAKKAKKISKSKWFELYNQSDTKVLPPLYEI